MPSLNSAKSSGGNSLLGTSAKHVMTYFSKVSSGNLACNISYYKLAD